MLAPIYSANEQAIVLAAINGLSYSVWSGVKCATATNGDWTYDGSNFINNDNSNWCDGEPNANCGSEACMQLNYSSGKCWNDLSCGTTIGYICAVPICKRE